MPTQYINIPLVNKSYDGALRWLSNKTQIPDLHGSEVIRISSDSIRDDTSLTSPIGYHQPEKADYFVSGDDNHSINDDGEEPIHEHWYLIDLLSFQISLTGYTITREPQHYNKNWILQTSNDCENFITVDNQTMLNEPKKWEFTSKLETPVNARCVKLWTNSYRFDNESTLSLTKMDLFGRLRWYTSCTCQNNVVFHYSYFAITLAFSTKYS